VEYTFLCYFVSAGCKIRIGGGKYAFFCFRFWEKFSVILSTGLQYCEAGESCMMWRM
jgi:hypothetical protein